MRPTGLHFDILHGDQTLQVDEIAVNKDLLYRVLFADGTMLVLTQGRHADGERFWTSLPQGRQELAEAIGALIDQHLQPGGKRLKQTPPGPAGSPPNTLF